MTLRKYIFLLPIVALSACADDVLQSGPEIPADSSDDIRVGCGFYTGSDELSVESRATSGLGDVSPAELLEWLRQPLFDGFEITYFQTPATGSSPSTKRMAKLQLVKKSDSANGYETVTEEGTQKTLAKYNFKEIAGGTVTDKNAKWFDNGKHTFQGIYAPDAILKYESKVPSTTLTSDQSKEGNGTNYTSLTQYSAMPKDQVINATVQRVLLPFQHRLARVFAYILIDPEMKDVTLEGYTPYVTDSEGNVTQKDDPTTTSLRFENVKVLEYVEKKQNETTHLFDYTPHWTEARKVIPHFRAELGSINVKGENLNNDFILFKKTSTDEFVTCDDTEKWKAAYNSYNEKWDEYVKSHPISDKFSKDEQKKAAKAYAEAESGYIMTNYGKVPVYDIIVRPTYDKDTDIMYDEADLTNTTNQIDFKLKLSNGLEYEKRFKFDLNPNQMTVVYLRINREQIDYNTSGAEKWISNAFVDGYYGVNNENGNRLSLAGGSWQRAYRNSKGSGPGNITDGSDYNEDKEEDHITGENGQYISDEKWIARFFEAKEGGSHHGDYFILDKDITIPASSIPADFVFTGHLDGRGHTITISAASPGEGGEGPSTRDEDIGSGGGSASKPYLFAGLNAHYTTAQENAEDPKNVTWEANVHKENGKWVPVAGYRAEVLNTTVSGARMFKAGTTMGKADGYIDAETKATKYYDIDGYVFNCKDDITEKVENIQDIPNY